jgi:hypothetical protein
MIVTHEIQLVFSSIYLCTHGRFRLAADGTRAHSEVHLQGGTPAHIEVYPETVLDALADGDRANSEVNSEMAIE